MSNTPLDLHVTTGPRFEVRPLKSGEGLVIVDTHNLEHMRGPWSLRDRGAADVRCAEMNVSPLRPHAWIGSIADDVNFLLCAVCYKHEAHAIHHKEKKDA